MLEIDVGEFENEFKDIKKEGSLDGQSLKLIESVISSIKNADRNRRDSIKLKAFSHIRLDCYRIQYELSTAMNSMHKNKMLSMLKKLNTLIDHTRYASDMEAELKQCSVFHHLWFWKNDLNALLKQALDIQVKSHSIISAVLFFFAFFSMFFFLLVSKQKQTQKNTHTHTHKIKLWTLRYIKATRKCSVK